MEGNTSYHLILGHPWLKAYKVVASIYHQCVKAVWRNRQVVIEATRMPFDRAELHFAEAALYQEYEPEGENKILSFNPITLQREEKDAGEFVVLERPSKIQRTTRLDGKVEELIVIDLNDGEGGERLVKISKSLSKEERKKLVT
nr:hypothetical protein CFP56_28280 [Quercus suber]